MGSIPRFSSSSHVFKHGVGSVNPHPRRSKAQDSSLRSSNLGRRRRNSMQLLSNPWIRRSGGRSELTCESLGGTYDDITFLPCTSISSRQMFMAMSMAYGSCRSWTTDGTNAGKPVLLLRTSRLPDSFLLLLPFVPRGFAADVQDARSIVHCTFVFVTRCPSVRTSRSRFAPGAVDSRTGWDLLRGGGAGVDPGGCFPNPTWFGPGMPSNRKGGSNRVPNVPWKGEVDQRLLGRRFERVSWICDSSTNVTNTWLGRDPTSSWSQLDVEFDRKGTSGRRCVVNGALDSEDRSCRGGWKNVWDPMASLEKTYRRRRPPPKERNVGFRSPVRCWTNVRAWPGNPWILRLPERRRPCRNSVCRSPRERTEEMSLENIVESATLTLSQMHHFRRTKIRPSDLGVMWRWVRHPLLPGENWKHG